MKQPDRSVFVRGAAAKGNRLQLLLVGVIVVSLASLAVILHFSNSGTDGISPAPEKAASGASAPAAESGRIARPQGVTRHGAGISGSGAPGGAARDSAKDPGGRASSGSEGSAVGRSAAVRDPHALREPPSLPARDSAAPSESETEETVAGSEGSAVGHSAAVRDPHALREPPSLPARDSAAPSESETEEAVVKPPDDEQGAISEGADQSRFSTAERVQVPPSADFGGETGTVGFRFQPEWSGDNQENASLVDIADGRLVIRKDTSFLRFEMTADNGTKTSTAFSLADRQPEQPLNVTASWGDGTMSLYVDGKVVARQHYSNPFEIPAGALVSVGSDPDAAPIAPGSLSNLQISKEVLGPTDVAARAGQVLSKTN